jgi:hypothetical protein
MKLSRRSALALPIAAALAPSLGQAQPAGLPRLKVSADGRRIVRVDGSPFFWLGDTAWELFHRLSLAEAAVYLEDRARKGFNVIQAVALAELDGLRTPNANGDLPLVDVDPTRPNEAYFRHVDAIIDLAASKGLYTGLLPTWGDKFYKRWGVGPEVFTPANARAYGAFIGRRYKDRPIIWIMGGDRNPDEPGHLAIVRGMAEGVRSEVGRSQLMTYHPQGGSASWDWFHNDPWIDLHVFQSGHSERDIANDAFTDKGWALQPVRPVLDSEPRYEDHPINWKPESGWFDEADVRQAAWWSVLAGAAGHTYGDHNIWQMWQPGRDPISAARTPWRQAIAHPGSAQMGHLRRLMESRDFLRLVPRQDLLAGNLGAGPSRKRAAASPEALIAYTPFGEPLTVRTAQLGPGPLRAWWFDPRTGKASRLGLLKRQAEQTFTPAGPTGRGRDWVLIIYRASRAMRPPGRRLTPQT